MRYHQAIKQVFPYDDTDSSDNISSLPVNRQSTDKQSQGMIDQSEYQQGTLNQLILDLYIVVVLSDCS